MQWTEALPGIEAATVNADGHDLEPDVGTPEGKHRTADSAGVEQGAKILEAAAHHGSKDDEPMGEVHGCYRQRRNLDVASHPWHIFLPWSHVLVGGHEDEDVLIVAVVTWLIAWVENWNAAILDATSGATHDRFEDLLKDNRPPCPLDIYQGRRQFVNHPCRPLACTMMDRKMSHDDDVVVVPGNGLHLRVQMISLDGLEDPHDDRAWVVLHNVLVHNGDRILQSGRQFLQCLLCPWTASGNAKMESS